MTNLYSAQAWQQVSNFHRHYRRLAVIISKQISYQDIIVIKKLANIQNNSTTERRKLFQSSPKGDYCSPSPSETLAPPLNFEIIKQTTKTGCSVELLISMGRPFQKIRKRTMTQESGQNAQALFTYFRDGVDLNMTSSQSLMDNRNANRSDTNVFASDREITVTDADAGPALRTPPMLEIQYFIMRLMELLTGCNAFAIDLWANPIAQAQIQNYVARAMHVPEVTRYAEISPHQILINAANSRIDRYIQNLWFQILMLYKLTILSIQHVLDGNTKETLIDLVGMCAALLRFAERQTYIRIQMKEGAQEAQQFDPGYKGSMSHAIQPLRALRLIQGQESQDLISQQAGQYLATAIGTEQQIPKLVTLTPTQMEQQFYSGQLIPRPQIQQPFQGFGMYPGIQQIQGFQLPGLFQQTQPSGFGMSYIDSQASPRAYPNSCRTLQPLDYKRLNNLIYQLHQHQARRAIHLFNTDTLEKYVDESFIPFIEQRCEKMQKKYKRIQLPVTSDCQQFLLKALMKPNRWTQSRSLQSKETSHLEKELICQSQRQKMLNLCIKSQRNTPFPPPMRVLSEMQDIQQLPKKWSKR
ncbi:MAG: hypothetical protein EZS28_002016 [Streblomastix strix]|uniref:Uncharacterized protein n=1 Tax=Streblomastix strix TaxID=222440 RepID=A0A5J4X6R9_9EUKA|nr:MAG: hypothetical protein EZS28_002016 [Streblomastix strix]